jgi:hypothetical protein
MDFHHEPRHERFTVVQLVHENFPALFSTLYLHNGQLMASIGSEVHVGVFHHVLVSGSPVSPESNVEASKGMTEMMLHGRCYNISYSNKDSPNLVSAGFPLVGFLSMRVLRERLP